jgi:hypothetical protein
LKWPQPRKPAGSTDEFEIAIHICLTVPSTFARPMEVPSRIFASRRILTREAVRLLN